MSNKVSIRKSGTLEIWEAKIYPNRGTSPKGYEVVILLTSQGGYYGFSMLPKVIENPWLTLEQADSYFEWLVNHWPYEGLESVEDFVGLENLDVLRSEVIEFLASIGVK